MSTIRQFTKNISLALKKFETNQSNIKSFHQIAPLINKLKKLKKKKNLTQRETLVLRHEAKGMKTETKNAAAQHGTLVADLFLRETKKAPTQYFPLSS